MGHQPAYDQFNVDFLFFGGRPGTFVGTVPAKFRRENIGLKCVFLEWALRKSFFKHLWFLLSILHKPWPFSQKAKPGDKGSCLENAD